MSRFFLSVVLVTLITITSSLFPAAWAEATELSYFGALPGMSRLFQGKSPQNLGIQQGKLTSCPPSPNCVVSQGGDETHTIAPLTYQSDLETARQALLKVLTVVPRTTVVEETPNYIRIASESRLLGFVDDAEFYFPDDEKVIHLRSASRLGESDLGVNRRRLEQIRLAMQDLGV